jgi:hypothetical protein
MPGGPIFPHSAFPVTAGRVFPVVHVGAGANSKQEEGLGVDDATAIVSDVIWRLRFLMPPTLPSGTGKLRILSLANATSGALKINPKWASVAVEEDPSSATLNAEGTSTITWSTGDDDQYKETKVTLDADTLVVDEMVVMDFVIENTGTTLAVTSLHHVAIIWE